jgi:hypothetical protein
VGVHERSARHYDAFLPAAILIASALRHPFDWIVLALHFAIFPTRMRQTLRDVLNLWAGRR